MTNGNKTRAKITDVARLAGVSPSTVSCILKAPENNRFSESTNRKVLDVVRELNFRPATFAQQMKGKALPVIGLVIPSLMNHFYPEVTTGFSDRAKLLGYNVIFFNSDNNISQETAFVETLISLGVSGLALCGVYSEDEREKEIVERLNNLGIPVVRFDRYDNEPDCPYVGIDNFSAGYYMTEKIIQSGHRKIVCLAPEKTVYIVNERRRGYVEAMKNNGLEPCIYQFRQNEFGSIYQSVETMIRELPDISALFAISGDLDAIECIKSASRLNIHVPSQLSVVGYDDIDIAGMINPSLTTIRQPKFEIGEIAMDLLKQMIDGEKLTRDHGVLLPFEYVPRESVSNIV